jgi:hypothetical protein
MLSLASAIVAGAMQIIDERTQDGSRHFVCLPQAATWTAICQHTLLLPGAEMVNFVGDGLALAWLDFEFRQHRFLIKIQDGQFCLFVRDPQCPDLTLCQVGYHFERLLGETAHDRGKAPHPHTATDARPATSQRIG